MASMFCSDSWAHDVRAALDAAPNEAALAGKLPQYWDVYDVVRTQYSASWALVVRNLPAELGGGERHLYLSWSGYFVQDCRVVPGADAADATYVLAADYTDWMALCDGYDVLRSIMYRRVTLERGDLLEFFKAIYFFAESLAVIASVPTTFPAVGV
ncbi:hypothetical protein [Mycobacterium sp. DL592]|uniref:hypothetical protein n=1 Tax=Mycobacterium sp. DL592 TaxID=2675524 RepID=UPI0014225A62|nr:hypothetical protein [Mycobacterium sp. DL592]